MTLEQFDTKRLYNRWRVQCAFREWLVGGMPRNADLIEAWVKAGTGHNDDKTKKLIQENAELVVNEVAEKMWTGFPEDKDGIFLPTRQIKAMLKQSGSLLRLTEKKRGSKQILAEGLEVVAISTNGKPAHRDRIRLPEVTGMHEQAIHVKTPAGPRSALKRFDYVSKPVLNFEIWVLKTDSKEKRHIGETELVDILTHGQENGLGASRSQGYGKFDVVEFQSLD